MKLITPSEAIQKIDGFLSRMDRLRNYKHSEQKFRTADLNKLKYERPRMSLYCSIAIHCKNKERAESKVKQAREQIQWIHQHGHDIEWEWQAPASDGCDFIKGEDFFDNKYESTGQYFNTNSPDIDPIVHEEHIEKVKEFTRF